MIITDERLIAASRTYRFGGWTTRPYSILEHMVIGAIRLKEEGFNAAAWGGFLLHDIEETELVGDVQSPHKDKYMNQLYFLHVKDFNVDLAAEAGMGSKRLDSPMVKKMDDDLWRVEALVLNARVLGMESDRLCSINERTYNLTHMVSEGAYSREYTVPMWKSLYAELTA